MTEWHPVIASVVANHYERSEEFQREQAGHMADVIQEVFDIVGLPPGVTEGDRIFRSVYSVERLIARLHELAD